MPLPGAPPREDSGHFANLSVLRIVAISLCLLSCVSAKGFTHRETAVIDSLETLLRRNPRDSKVLRRYWHYCTERGDFDRVVRSTAATYVDASRDGDDAMTLYAAVMAGQAYAALNNSDSMHYYLFRAETLAERRHDAWALGTVCNTLGTHAVDREMNFYKAISCFTRGMEFTEGKVPACYYALEGNLAIVYYLRNDPEGLRYARDVLQYGEESDNPFYTFIGSQTSAYLLHLSGRDAEALAASRKALALVDRFYDHAGVYTLHADILAANGDDAAAREYYLKAFDHLRDADAKSTADTYLNYGGWLLRKRRTTEAIRILREGLASNSFADGNCLYRYRFYKGLSEAYSRLGDDRTALDYYRRYHEEADSIFRIDREHSLNELGVRYETEKHRRVAEQKKAELLDANRRAVVAVAVMLLVLVVLTMTGVSYYRKNRMYRLIAQQYREALEKEQAMAGMLAALRSRQDADGAETEVSADTEDGVSEKTGSVGENERQRNLYERLDGMMRRERLYCENGLSIDGLAARLSTNRTYLSAAINRFAGVPFKVYVNSFRIDEAVRILSQTDDDTPLKELSDYLGFNTLSTFYRSFQSVVGMPPSRFRREMRFLARTQG